MKLYYVPVLFIVYVGAGTVGAAAWWFTMYEKGPQLNYYQLVMNLYTPVYRFRPIHFVLYDTGQVGLRVRWWIGNLRVRGSIPGVVDYIFVILLKNVE